MGMGVWGIGAGVWSLVQSCSPYSPGVCLSLLISEGLQPSQPLHSVLTYPNAFLLVVLTKTWRSIPLAPRVTKNMSSGEERGVVRGWRGGEEGEGVPIPHSLTLKPHLPSLPSPSTPPSLSPSSHHRHSHSHPFSHHHPTLMPLFHTPTLMPLFHTPTPIPLFPSVKQQVFRSVQGSV